MMEGYLLAGGFHESSVTVNYLLPVVFKLRF